MYDTYMKEYHQSNATKPMGFVEPPDAKQVANWVVCAGKASIPYRIRNGGHSYTARSVVDKGIVIDMRKFSNIDVSADGQSATIGGGQMLGSIYTDLGKAGKMLPMGVGASVGISGLTLGGGVGAVIRKHGPTCDSVISAKVVLSSGRIIDHDEMVKDHKDLLWALSGGGPFYAVVLEWKFKIYDAPKNVVQYVMNAPMEQSVAVLKAFAAWKPWTLGPEFMFVEFFSGYTKASITIFYEGTETDFKSKAETAVKAAFAKPGITWKDKDGIQISQNTWTEHYLKFTDLKGDPKNPGTADNLTFASLVASRQGSQRTFAATSLMLKDVQLTEGTIAKLCAFTTIDPSVKGFVQVHALNPALGAVAGDKPNKNSAWAYHEAHMECQIYDEVGDRSGGVRKQLIEEINALPSMGFFYNHMYDSIPVDKYFGANAEKLKVVKRMYDGGNRIMGAVHSIAPAAGAAGIPAAAGTGAGAAGAAGAIDFCIESAAMAKNIFDFWKKTQVVPSGHFFMSVGVKNTETSDGTNGIFLIHQSRHLYFFSEYAHTFKDEAAKGQAQTLFEYLKGKKLAAGGFPVNLTTPNGSNLMATMFALYGIATFIRYAAKPDQKAAALAVMRETYASTNSLFDDVLGAYVKEGDIKYELPPNPPPTGYVSLNMMMHAIEALTPMCLADPAGKYEARLKKMLTFVFEEMYVVDGDGGFLPDHTFTGYVRGDIVNYGHQAQMVWILETAMSVAGMEMTAANKGKLINICKKMDEGWVDVGTDKAMGWVKEKSGQDKRIVWWVQAEALLGYAWMSINAGDLKLRQEHYQKFLKLWAFVQKYFVDKENGGEWRDELDTNFKTTKEDKGHEWKGNYHTGRCAFILKEYCPNLKPPT